MSLLNQKNNKGKKKADKKSKSSSGFVSKQANTGSQRGS
jgi:hypothetical protein